MNPPLGCLFDLDGLLLDTEQLHSQAWKLAASNFGINLNPEDLAQLRGRRRIDCINQICNWAEKDIKKENFIKEHQPISQRLIKNAKAMQGAKELVKYCQSLNLPIALVTSSSTNSYRIKSSPHPWLEGINIKILGDDPEIKEGKPSPEPYLLAAKRLNLNPKKCWALEDSDSGINSALSAGCTVWALIDKRDKNSSIQKLNINPNLIYINELSSVKNKLEDLFESINN
mgnify:CR=1 FL=1|tara:strand:+ start:140 stop:826 length:687 start_codon:yes stop_codon:yes gene_type:complete